MRKKWGIWRVLLIGTFLCGGMVEARAMSESCSPRNPIFGWVEHEEEYHLAMEQSGEYDYIRIPTVRKTEEIDHVQYEAEGLRWIEAEKYEDTQCVPISWSFAWYPRTQKLFYRSSVGTMVEIPLLSNEEIYQIIQEKGETTYNTAYQGRLYDIFKEIYTLVEGKAF